MLLLLIFWLLNVSFVTYNLQRTKSLGLDLTQLDFTLSAYFDSNWVVDIKDQHSVTEYCIFIGDNHILWTSKKQHTIAKSSIKAKYKALACTTMDVCWLIMILAALCISIDRPP